MTLLGHEQLKVLSGLTNQPKVCAGLAARRIFRGHEADLQLHQVVGGYTACITETVGESILLELTLPVVWNQLDEHLRFSLLGLLCSQLIDSAKRSTRKADAALRAAEARWGTEG